MKVGQQREQRKGAGEREGRQEREPGKGAGREYQGRWPGKSQMKAARK
jgi:hypothetical protein